MGLAILTDDAILVINAGSTSLKLSVVATDGSTTPLAALDDAPARLAGVAHRVVHGGHRFRDPVLIDDEVERQLAEVTELAPLHNAPALEAIRRARTELPDLRHVAVFDSAFHATIPAEAATYALPARIREEWGTGGSASMGSRCSGRAGR